MGTPHRVIQELPEAEAPSLNTELCGSSHSGQGEVEAREWATNPTTGMGAFSNAARPNTLGLLGRINGPVGDVICDPGVAGQAP